jgi:hypothetical protein
LRPRFYVTFWPATKQVSVRYVGEVANTEALEAFTYNLSLSIRRHNPQTLYKQHAVQHSIATRWTRSAWLGGVPETKVNINHNVGYLADTKFVLNYDRSLKIPESVTETGYKAWSTTDRKIGGAGPIPAITPTLARCHCG